MASRNRKEEKAEGAARYAADEIKSAREERESSQEQQQMRRDDNAPRSTYTTTTTATEGQTNRPGIISSVVGALGSTYEHAKEAVTGKTHDAAEKTKEAADATARSMKQSHDDAAVRAREDAEWARMGRDNTAESLRQTKDAAVGKTKDAAGYVADKTKDAAGKTKDTAGYAVDRTKDTAGYVADKTVAGKDYAVDKTVEGKDATVGKLSELKDSAADAGKRAMGYLSGKTEETKEKVGEAAEVAKEKAWETKEEAKGPYKGIEDAARRRMEEERIESLRQKGYNTVVDDDAVRGEAGKNNTIFGAIGNMAEAVKSKLTMPGEGEEARGRRLDGGKEVTITVEESPPGAAADILKDTKKAGVRGGGVGAMADLLKDADQITGQSYSPNDVGRMD